MQLLATMHTNKWYVCTVLYTYHSITHFISFTLLVMCILFFCTKNIFKKSWPISVWSILGRNLEVWWMLFSRFWGYTVPGRFLKLYGRQSVLQKPSDTETEKLRSQKRTANFLLSFTLHMHFKSQLKLFFLQKPLIFMFMVCDLLVYFSQFNRTNFRSIFV